MKYLVAGLGNIGSEYLETRHNIGFKVLDALAAQEALFFEQSRLAFKAEWKYKGRLITLIKPSTYMNLSGKAVSYWLTTLGIEVENLLVLTDDIALPFGALRIRKKGSDGGHNGLKDIQEVLQTVDYPRLRFGVGSDFNKGKQVEYVLGKWTQQEADMLPERIALATDAIRSFVFAGIDNTMNLFNK